MGAQQAQWRGRIYSLDQGAPQDDWERVSPGAGAAPFSAELSMNINKPSCGGVDAQVR